MTLPIAVEVRGGAGYIRYRDDAIVQTVEVTPTCSVAADLNAQGDVVAIEVLDVAVLEQLVAAKDFAAASGLAFPRDLSGALVPT